MTMMTHSAPVDHLDVACLIARVRDAGGFFVSSDIARLAAHPSGRLTRVLIRAGGCRLICAAQDVTHIEACLTAGGDYLREVSLPADQRCCGRSRTPTHRIRFGT